MWPSRGWPMGTRQKPSSVWCPWQVPMWGLPSSLQQPLIHALLTVGTLVGDQNECCLVWWHHGDRRWPVLFFLFGASRGPCWVTAKHMIKPNESLMPNTLGGRDSITFRCELVRNTFLLAMELNEAPQWCSDSEAPSQLAMLQWQNWIDLRLRRGIFVVWYFLQHANHSLNPSSALSGVWGGQA